MISSKLKDPLVQEHVNSKLYCEGKVVGHELDFHYSGWFNHSTLNFCAYFNNVKKTLSFAIGAI